MCLSKLKDFPVMLDKNGVGTGWKVFRLSRNGNLYTIFYGCSRSRPIGKWIRCKKRKVFTDEFSSYPSGFHIFTDKSVVDDLILLRNDKLVQVKFRNILAKGIQYDMCEGYKAYNIIVAEEMLIPKIPKNKKNKKIK